ncbi:MAG: hotdog domain-containing protein [Paracoccus sp. (in: a-proteobacteria)]
MRGEREPGQREDYLWLTSHTTRWNDNDSYGHMNNAVHYQLFDTTVNAWLHRAGLRSAADFSVNLVVESGCRYHSELRFPSEIVAGLRIGRLGSSSVRYEIGLFDAAAEVAAAEGFLVHVRVDHLSRRPQPLDDAVRDTMRRLIKQA